VAAGEGLKPSVSAFKAQRVAYLHHPAIEGSPKSQVQCPKTVFVHWTMDFGLVLMVGALGFEPRTLRLSGANTVYKTVAPPLSYAPKAVSKVSSPMSKVCFRRVDFGHWTLDLGLVFG
jgi:hypothetical protein